MWEAIKRILNRKLVDDSYKYDTKFLLDVKFLFVVILCVLISVYVLKKIAEALKDIESVSQNYSEVNKEIYKNLNER